jgi:hypothetical protein
VPATPAISAVVSDVIMVQERHLGVQTSVALSSGTPRKLHLRKKLHSARIALNRSRKTVLALRKKLISLRKVCSQKAIATKRMNDVVKSAAKFLTGDCLKLFEMQLRQSLKNSKGRRYTDDEKLMALTLYTV